MFLGGLPHLKAFLYICVAVQPCARHPVLSATPRDSLRARVFSNGGFEDGVKNNTCRLHLRFECDTAG